MEYRREKKRKKLFYCVAATVCACFIACVAVKAGERRKPNDNTGTNIPAYGVLAEVVGISHGGFYEVRIIGGDQNFAKDDIVTLDYNHDISNGRILKIGERIAVTYFEFEKTEGNFVITPGQVELVTP